MPEQRKRTLATGAPRGFTLVEMMVALCVMTITFSAFLGVGLETVRDYEFFTRQNLVSMKNQQIVNNIRQDILSTKQYFGQDIFPSTITSDYYNALEWPMTAPPPVDTLRLPTIDANGNFEPDIPGNEKTGNALFIVKTLEPFERKLGLYYEPDGFGGQQVVWEYIRVNQYRFILYYLTRYQNDTISTSPDSLDLIRWASIPYLDYNQVVALVDPDPGDDLDPQAQLLATFVADTGSNYIWRPGEPVNNGFYYVNGFGIITGLVPGVTILNDTQDGITSQISGELRTGKRTSICMNRGTLGFERGPVLPMYAVASQLGDGFPHGFETQIIGPSGARQLFLHVVMGKDSSKGIIAKAFKGVLTTRDF